MTDGQLEQYALNYLKECKPKMLRELRRAGELQDHLDDQVEACKRYAQTLMEQGTSEGQAFHWAVRVKLLESPMD